MDLDKTILAFYTNCNPTDKPIDGIIITYNILPFKARPYYQCFGFEEQHLNPYVEVDIPVYFCSDPEFVYDPFLK